MRLDVIFPDGKLERTTLGDGEHTQVSQGDEILVRVTRVSEHHVAVEIRPPAEVAAPRERVRFHRSVA